MTLTNVAEITVHSVIENLTEAGLPDGEPEINLFTVKGTFSKRNEEYDIKYDEKNEEYTTHCSLTANSDRVFLSRKGAVDCNITFKEGEKCNCIYRVPPYAFDMVVTTSKIRNSLNEKEGELQLIYSMNIGGQDKKVRMRIKVKK